MGPSAFHDVVIKWFSHNVQLALMSRPHEYARDEQNGDPRVAPGSKTPQGAFNNKQPVG